METISEYPVIPFFIVPPIYNCLIWYILIKSHGKCQIETCHCPKSKELYVACEKALTSCHFILKQNNRCNQKRASATAILHPWSSLGLSHKLNDRETKFAQKICNFQHQPVVWSISSTSKLGYYIRQCIDIY